jgi:acetolactate synthase I/II/III large subunit
VSTGLLHERGSTPCFEITNHLIRHHSRGRRWPHVRSNDKSRVIPRGQPQQQITQRQVCDETPLAHQIMQEVAIRVAQIRSLQRCAIQESHGRSVRLHYGEQVTQIHGGGHVVDAAQAAGVRTLFTLSGAHIFPVYDAAVGGKAQVESAASPRDAERGGPLRLVDTRHEQTAAFAAEATGKLTRTPGFAAVTAGPGVTNAISAVTSAWFNGSPMVLMGGRSPDHRWGSGALQELDQPPILRPVTKGAWTIHDAAQIRAEADRAFTLAASVHRGPVFFDIPMDVLFTPADRSPHPPAHIDRGADPDPDVVQIAARMLAGAQRPIVILGGDVWMGDAVDAARHFVDQRNIPVIANGMGRGVIPPSDAHLVSRARGAAFAQADLVIVVGTPLDFRLGYGTFGDPPAPVIHIVDSDTNLSGAATCTIVGNIGQTLTALANDQPTDGDWVTSLRAVADAAIASDQAVLHSDADPIHPARIYGELLPRLTDDAIVIGDGGDFVSFAGRFIEPTRPGNWLDPGPYGCLGTGPGYALAAGIARPQSPHVLLLGDGAAGFSMMDVDALVRHSIPTVIIVGNNASWALEKHPMRFLYGYDVIADLGATRYDEVVIALGGGGELVTHPSDIGPAIDRAMASGIPYCVNVMTDPSIAYPRSTTGV